ncbi:PQQ-dependent sugar dehydrogenase [Aliiglaciecola litoralis]|uniref:PQQ-dependent sugar dehydrogenase n=1 Tax=Aliiglaciecola litoralis TaxID=582857 RepID=A0ABP3X3P8_9ALTE
MIALISKRMFTILSGWMLITFSAVAMVNINSSDGVVIQGEELETFNRPWAMAFLPSGQALVTEKSGAIWLVENTGKKITTVAGAPEISARGQGGMGDIIVHPDFGDNGVVFISYVERDPNDDAFSGAVVERATLSLSNSAAKLEERKIIWRQSPKVSGNGHYAHRLALSPDGKLFITSGERQKFTPAQNMAMNLGKVVRINQDGSIPEDNPFYVNGPITNQIWSLGHRNPLGIDFDLDGQLWVHEMGPRHGDELNLIEKARNYGYPNVSEGAHYSGVEIPSHDTVPVYVSPVVAWVPAISPAGFVIYKGDKYPNWKGDGFIGGLSSKAIIRVEFEKHQERPHLRAKEAARYEWGQRVREIEQNQQGELFVLEDGENGRLIKLSVK